MDGERSTLIADLNRDLQTLQTGAKDWVSLPIRRKIEILAACRSSSSRNAASWIRLAARSKGIAESPLAGEEALTGPWAVLAVLNRYAATLAEIEHSGAPRLAERRVRARADGQIVVEVFPEGFYDRLLQFGLRAEVWMQPGVTRATLRETMGTWYRRKANAPRIALVLGAGNIASIGLLDVLYKLIAQGAVCILKVHPLLEPLGPIFEASFAPLVDGGFLRFAYGGADVGRYLCGHPAIDEIHVTGSKLTYDAIAATNESGKPITSELGNVSPAIVVPGRWSDAELRFHAEQLATAKLHNAGFNCVALQTLVLPARWDRREALLAHLRHLFERAQDRPAYYPGAAERYRALVAGRRLSSHGTDAPGFLPRALVAADAADATEALFRTEAFSSLLTVVTLPNDDVKSYLENAVAFCNDRLWGDLAVNLIVDGATAATHRDAVDAAIAGLRYGCIGVNVWSAVGFLLPAIPWGGYAPRRGADVGSGIGVVHNSRLFEKSQKSVLYSPFLPAIKPPWFLTRRNQAKISMALCEFESARSPAAMAKVARVTLAG
ncbi:MAG: aldehyde dehydrogenase family protein [Candidatus Cybelea sp.]